MLVFTINELLLDVPLLISSLYHVYEGAYPFDSLVTKNEIGDPKQTVGFLAVGFSGMLVEIETVGLSPTISVKLPPFRVPQLLVTETVKILPLSDALALAIVKFELVAPGTSAPPLVHA